jgi:hypothetical protein
MALPKIAEHDNPRPYATTSSAAARTACSMSRRSGGLDARRPDQVREIELEQLTWGDVDEQRGRWRVSAAVAKSRRARWVSVPPVLFEAVCALLPREVRTPGRRVFAGFGGDRFRTAIARSCTAAGVPTFSPHDLRHRRISLEHLRGVPWARIGEHGAAQSRRDSEYVFTRVDR